VREGEEKQNDLCYKMLLGNQLVCMPVNNTQNTSPRQKQKQKQNKHPPKKTKTKNKQKTKNKKQQQQNPELSVEVPCIAQHSS
jgi:sortase (surface protein transpeptidase)